MSEFLKRIEGFSPKRLLLLAAELEEQVRALEATLEGRSHGPIAIVGIGCRYPGGVRDPQTFWELLSEGRDAITEVPVWRWNLDQLYDPDPHAKGKVATRWGGFLDSPELFDPAFFGIAPVEAVGMDPQQRLLLEVSWEALEDAAIAPSSLNGSRTGVFVGMCNSDYGQLALSQPAEEIEAYFAQGASHAVAAGRISYFLGLRGPSLAIDTACSSSLVAIHEACQSLRTQESDLALAGGVNLIFSPEVTIALSRAQMMAADGRCKAFSADANGFVRSEGCGVVVLKRLADAVRDGDRVVAVIRGTALNQDGRSSGITAPNGPSQEDVIRAALADAHISPEAISYVEAHGTGTSLGDTIEMQALGAALGQARADNGKLPIGSVKSNFGHAESAAGVAGLIKLALALKHRTIPGSLHCSTPNPKIDWEANRTRVLVEAEPWQPSPGYDLRFGSVSSFGFSGTNAHLVVSEPSADATDAASDSNEGLRVITLSARSDKALRTAAARLADRLREEPELRLRDVAYTLAVGRSSFTHRAAIRPDSREHLIEELALLSQNESDAGGPAEGQMTQGVVDMRAPRVAFLFAGQGGERTGMGLSLLQRSEVFRAAVAEVDAALAGTISQPIETIFRNEQNDLAQSSLVQPALFAFQYGLARLWQSWGVEPHIVVGHSMGELVAATIAGVMSVEDASRLVAARGRLTGELGDPGAMVAIAAPADQVQLALASYRHDVSIAAINGPASVVISGRSEAVELATQDFERLGVRVKRLNISYGSHSPAMHRVLPAFHQEAIKYTYRAPRLPILADLTGEKVEDDSVFNAQYWTAHLSRPVQFARCLERLGAEGCGLCIEMGPRAVLTAFGRERAGTKTRWVASANGRDDDFEALQDALAEAYAAGAALDWKAVFRSERARRVALPTYPFERERYWIADEEASQRTSDASPLRSAKLQALSRNLSPTQPGGELSGTQLDASLPIFEIALQSPLPLFLDEHRVGGQVVLPASGYLSLAWNAAHAAGFSPGRAAAIVRLQIARPLLLASDRLVQTVLSASSGDVSEFSISSRSASESEWTLHAKGELSRENAVSSAQEAGHFDTTAAQTINGDEFYRQLASLGIELGSAFRAVQELWYLPGMAHGRMIADERWHTSKEIGPHPALLDACFQTLGAAAITDGQPQLRLMTRIGRIEIHGALQGEMFIDSRVQKLDDGVLEGSIQVRDGAGVLLVSATGIELRAVAAEPEPLQEPGDWLYETAWEAKPLIEGASENTGKHWIVLGSAEGLAQKVVEQLSAVGETAELYSDPMDCIDIGEITAPCEYVDLRPVDAARKLAAALESDGAEAIARCAAELIAASVELWRRVLGHAGHLWIFTRGAQAAGNPMHATGAVQAPLWGFARCATLEHPQRLRRIVDLDLENHMQESAAVVIGELLARDDEEQIAYTGQIRQGFRIRRFEQPASQSTMLRKDASYLVTGGVGGLGLRVAAWLGKQGAGKVVLTTRSLGSIKARSEEIQALQASGIDIEVVTADVADRASMQALFARFGTGLDCPPLRGINHMAADIQGASAENIQPDQIESVFRAKVQGTWILHELTRNLPLDFMVGFSSTTAVLGAGSLGSYAAGNCFIDAMASLRATEGLPFVSINWGTWQTMRLATKEAQQQYSSGGLLPMQDEAALLQLGKLLHGGPRQIIVASIDWSQLAPLYEARHPRRWLDHVRPREVASNSEARLAWSVEPGESRLQALEGAIQKEAARVLGFRRGEVPGSHARLADLGLDSLMAVTLRNRLQLMVGLSLPSTFAFEYPSPAEMAAALDLLMWGSDATDDPLSMIERDEIRI